MEYPHPDTTAIWQGSLQSDVASGTCLGRTPRILYYCTLVESLLLPGSILSDRVALLLLHGQCLLTDPRSDQKGFQKHIRTLQVNVLDEG